MFQSLKSRFQTAQNTVPMPTINEQLEPNPGMTSDEANENKKDCFEATIRKNIMECSAFKEIEWIYYQGLTKPHQQEWLLCLSVFPDNSIMKRRAITNWWIGEISDDSVETDDMNIWKDASWLFDYLLSKGIIEPVRTNRRPLVKRCKMHPFTRLMLIALAVKEKFFEVDKASGEISYDEISNRENGPGKAFLYFDKEENRSSLYSLRDSRYLKKVGTLFNINESLVDIQNHWFSNGKKLKVLQLGRWEAAEHHIEVASTEFFKRLKDMKRLRYMSLQGISMIPEIEVPFKKNVNLRILDLKDCHDLRKPPAGLGKLVNLLVLDMSGCYHISHTPKEIKHLSKLRILKGFWVSHPPQPEHCRLVELANFDALEKLSICADVSKGADTETELRDLMKFKALRSLKIEWVDTMNAQNNTNASSSTHNKANDSVPMSKQTSRRKWSTSHPSLGRSKSAPPAMPVTGHNSTSQSILKLEKLDLIATPWKKIPLWLYHGNDRNFTKLYIRGGNLRHIRADNRMQTVKILRLKHLLQLEISWGELKSEFPKLDYVEQVDCPKCHFFPCDSKGVWVRRPKSN